MPRIARFNSQLVAPQRRLTYWNDVCTAALDGTMVDSPVDGFRAEMWQLTLGDLKLLRPRSDTSVVQRPAGTGDVLLMHLQIKGSSHFRTRARNRRNEAVLKAGDFVLSTAEHGYRFDLSSNHELIVAELPQALIAPHLPGLEDRYCRTYTSGTPGGRMFREFLLSLWRQPEDEGAACDGAYAHGISSAFSTLCALAVAGAEAAPEAMDGLLSLRMRCDSYIDAHLDDPELGTAALAAEFDVSPRTIQGLFAAIGTTPTVYIQQRRLQRAADCLRADLSRAITDIAFDFGFNDSAYFTRLFRRRFGCSPTEWRTDN
ncbi:helix-turn-helix domain-containing protein [Martelella radicis]|uniref:AraC-like DNA-binding protein n=1 Tax=Martelella radicis TaxID=1397476 RepID=A0A7W6KMZ5_9HYPH|nr:helix-turn-helix domain-containing protein [Martelella radicis]MBB4124304.1 AraC-like DNA-binding protein [Martelella radicis]